MHHFEMIMDTMVIPQCTLDTYNLSMGTGVDLLDPHMCSTDDTRYCYTGPV